MPFLHVYSLMAILCMVLGLAWSEVDQPRLALNSKGYNASNGDEDIGERSRLESEDPGPDANRRRDYAQDVELAEREPKGQFYSDVSYVKYEMAAAAVGNKSHFRTVPAEHRRDVAKEEATKDVIVLMVHNFPFTTKCNQKKAMLMKKEIESLGNSRFYIAHYLSGHNKTFMQAAIFDPETQTDVVYWAPVNTYLYNKKYGWELKWSVLRWLSHDTAYQRVWLVEDDVLLMGLADFVRGHADLPHKAISSIPYRQNTWWRHARTCRYHGKRCFDNKGAIDDTKQLSLVLTRLDRGLAGRLANIFLEPEYLQGQIALTGKWRPPTYGHFEALGGFVVQQEEKRCLSAGKGEAASQVIHQTLPHFHGNISLGSWGKFRTMPCVSSPGLNTGYQRAIRYLAGKEHRFRRTCFYHPIKCCSISKPRKLYGLGGEVINVMSNGDM